jgi:hypothetical protein
MEIEELFFFVLFFMMAFTILIISCIVPARFLSMFFKKTILCFICSVIIIVLLFLLVLWQEYPSSLVEWGDFLDSFFRVFVLVVFIDIFVGSILTYCACPKNKK